MFFPAWGIVTFEQARFLVRSTVPQIEWKIFSSRLSVTLATLPATLGKNKQIVKLWLHCFVTPPSPEIFDLQSIVFKNHCASPSANSLPKSLDNISLILPETRGCTLFSVSEWKSRLRALAGSTCVCPVTIFTPLCHRGDPATCGPTATIHPHPTLPHVTSYNLVPLF